MPAEEGLIPPLATGWDRFGSQGPVGQRRYLPEAGGWVYSIFTPNGYRIQGDGARAQEPFYVPDLAVWTEAIAKSIAGSINGAGNAWVVALLQQILKLLTLNQNQVAPLLTAIDADIKTLTATQGTGLLDSVDRLNVAIQAVIREQQTTGDVVQHIAADADGLLKYFTALKAPQRIVADFESSTAVAQPIPTRPGP